MTQRLSEEITKYFALTHALTRHNTADMQTARDSHYRPLGMHLSVASEIA